MNAFNNDLEGKRIQWSLFNKYDHTNKDNVGEIVRVDHDELLCQNDDGSYDLLFMKDIDKGNLKIRLTE